MAMHSADLTAFQKRLLTQYQSFFHHPPSLARLAVLTARSHILMLLVFAAAVTLCFSIDIAAVGYIMIGVFVGAICRDLGQFIKVTRAWPVLRRIINWDLLNSLLSDSKANTNAEQNAEPELPIRGS